MTNLRYKEEASLSPSFTIRVILLFGETLARKIRTAFDEIFSIICVIDTSIRLQAPARNLYATAFSYDGRLDSNEKNLQSQRSVKPSSFYRLSFYVGHELRFLAFIAKGVT